jgi:hypothetical protein
MKVNRRCGSTYYLNSRCAVESLAPKLTAVGLVRCDRIDKARYEIQKNASPHLEDWSSKEGSEARRNSARR